MTFSYPADIGAMDTTTTGLVVQALSQNWNKVLFGGNSTLLLSELDTSTFYSKMEALPTQIEMGFVSYGMDYFDASNMLSVYKAGGRHDWDNAQYDNLLTQGAAAFNTAKRQEIYTEAQTLLTYEAPAVFIFHGLDKLPHVAVHARDRRWPRTTSATTASSGQGSSPSPLTRRESTSATTSSNTPARARASNRATPLSGMKR